MEPDEGEEFHLDDPERWETLAVGKGDVLEVYLPATNLVETADIWAGFWVKQVFLEAGGEYTAILKSLGCSDPDWSKYLSGMFNRREGRAHFCNHIPCSAQGEFALHIRRVKVFSFAAFHRPYITAYIKRQVQKWEQEPLDEVGDETLDLSGLDSRRDGVAEEAHEEEAPKETVRAGPRPPALRPPKEPVRGKVSEEERKKLREKLEKVRGKMLDKQAEGGDGRRPGQPPPTHPGYDISSDVGSPSSPLDDTAIVEAKDKGLQLEDANPEKNKKKRRHKREETRLSGSTTKMKALEDSKDGTTRSLQTQLLKQATETAQKKRTKEKAEKRKSTQKSPGWQLARILTKVLQSSGSQGAGGGSHPPGDLQQKKKKQERAEKKRKRKKSTGMDPSSSPASSKEDSSGSGSPDDWDFDKEGDSSSSDEKKLDAPLRRKSRKRPGSVLQMLIEHARSQLDQSAKVGVESEQNVTITSGVKMSSYFAIVVRPQLGQAMAQTRELHHLAQCIDLLRQGDLDVLGDVLAGRFMSLHQSVLDGTWATAKHLELLPLEEGSAAGPAVVLQAKRHARLAEKVSQGPWSWQPMGKARGGRGRGQSWNDNQLETKGKGKKGPKGKGKNKNWSHQSEKELDGKGKERIPEK